MELYIPNNFNSQAEAVKAQIERKISELESFESQIQIRMRGNQVDAPRAAEVLICIQEYIMVYYTLQSDLSNASYQMHIQDILRSSQEEVRAYLDSILPPELLNSIYSLLYTRCQICKEFILTGGLKLSCSCNEYVHEKCLNEKGNINPNGKNFYYDCARCNQRTEIETKVDCANCGGEFQWCQVKELQTGKIYCTPCYQTLFPESSQFSAVKPSSKPNESTPKPQEKVPKLSESTPRPQEEVPKPNENIPKPQEKVPKPNESTPKPQEKVPKSNESTRKPQEKVPKLSEEGLSIDTEIEKVHIERIKITKPLFDCFKEDINFKRTAERIQLSKAAVEKLNKKLNCVIKLDEFAEGLKNNEFLSQRYKEFCWNRSDRSNVYNYAKKKGYILDTLFDKGKVNPLLVPPFRPMQNGIAWSEHKIPYIPVDNFSESKKMCSEMGVDFANYRNEVCLKIGDFMTRLNYKENQSDPIAMYLCGPPSKGKTMFCNWIQKFFSPVFHTKGSSFFSAETGDLFIYDDSLAFGQIISNLVDWNGMTTSQEYVYNIKYGTGRMYKPVVLVITNIPLETIEKHLKPEQQCIYQAFRRRFLYVNLEPYSLGMPPEFTDFSWGEIKERKKFLADQSWRGKLLAKAESLGIFLECPSFDDDPDEDPDLKLHYKFDIHYNIVFEPKIYLDYCQRNKYPSNLAFAYAAKVLSTKIQGKEITVKGAIEAFEFLEAAKGESSKYKHWINSEGLNTQIWKPFSISTFSRIEEIRNELGKRKRDFEDSVEPQKSMKIIVID